MKRFLVLFFVFVSFLNIKTLFAFNTDKDELVDCIINFDHKKVTEYKYYKKVDLVRGHYYKIKFNVTNPIDYKKEKYHFYYSKNNAKRKDAPTIIILPPAIGLSGYDFAISHLFQRKGFNVIILPLGLNVEDKNLYLEDLDKKNATNIEKIRGAIDILPNLPGHPSVKNIFVMGVSLGAIGSVYAIELEPRIRAAVIYMGGTNIKDIFKTVSAKGTVRKFVTKHYKKLENGTKKEFEEYLNKNLVFDLDTIPYTRDPEDILMFIAMKDNTVKTELQFKLREDLGNPKYYPIYGDHTFGALTIAARIKKISKFFKSRIH